VETPCKFITAKINKYNNNIYYCSLLINLHGVSTNKTIIYFIAMQTYKELNVILAKISEQLR
jgi:hypothetical protein